MYVVIGRCLKESVRSIFLPISIMPFLAYHYERRVLHDCFSYADEYCRYRAVLLCVEVVSHLHGFKHYEGLTFLYRVATLHTYVLDDARQRSLYCVALHFALRSGDNGLLCCRRLWSDDLHDFLLYYLLFQFYGVWLAVYGEFHGLIADVAYHDFIFVAVDSIFKFFHVLVFLLCRLFFRSFRCEIFFPRCCPQEIILSERLESAYLNIICCGNDQGVLRGFIVSMPDSLS